MKKFKYEVGDKVTLNTEGEATCGGEVPAGTVTEIVEVLINWAHWPYRVAAHGGLFAESELDPFDAGPTGLKAAHLKVGDRVKLVRAKADHSTPIGVDIGDVLEVDTVSSQAVFLSGRVGRHLLAASDGDYLDLFEKVEDHRSASEVEEPSDSSFFEHVCDVLGGPATEEEVIEELLKRDEWRREANRFRYDAAQILGIPTTFHYTPDDPGRAAHAHIYEDVLRELEQRKVEGTEALQLPHPYHATVVGAISLRTALAELGSSNAYATIENTLNDLYQEIGEMIVYANEGIND